MLLAQGTCHLNLDTAQKIYHLPFSDLLFNAHTTHRKYFDPNVVQICRLLSIKTGGCPEDCGYCSQSARYNTGIKATKLMDLLSVINAAKIAKQSGATRFCLGAAWRSPKDRDMPAIVAMVNAIKEIGLEICMTLGMLSQEQAMQLGEAGLDYYNHNIDTSKRFYSEVVTTHTFLDRLQTLGYVHQAGIKICCGGILGLGESVDDRIDMLVTLANLSPPPKSVPINLLIPMSGTKLELVMPIHPIEFVRIIALARILLPESWIRLSAGRTLMSDEMQALCFYAGANSIFSGETLLTAANPTQDKDGILMQRLGMKAQPSSSPRKRGSRE